MLLKLIVLLVVGCRKLQPPVVPAYAPVFTRQDRRRYHR